MQDESSRARAKLEEARARAAELQQQTETGFELNKSVDSKVRSVVAAQFSREKELPILHVRPPAQKVRKLRAAKAKAARAEGGQDASEASDAGSSD